MMASTGPPHLTMRGIGLLNPGFTGINAQNTIVPVRAGWSGGRKVKGLARTL